MKQFSLFLDEKEDEIIEIYKQEWKISKNDTIRKMIRDWTPEEEEVEEDG